MFSCANLPVGITVGDPAGVGPEIVARALGKLRHKSPFRLYGPDLIVQELAQTFPRCQAVPTTVGLDGIRKGEYTRESGIASIAALKAAIADFAQGNIKALVTGPISKKSLADAGLHYPGQTEWIADALRTPSYAMMLFGPKLRITLVTTHLPLKEVPEALTEDTILEKIILTADFLHRMLRIETPKIAVLGLNPHASDGGMFGNEEMTKIMPAIVRAREAGIEAFGPLPADTAFFRAFRGDYDAIVAMYHDQGLAPLKLVHFEAAVNVTLGLPRLRCSPDHGPAYDIAQTGLASHKSMLAALRLAVQVH